ncbi:MAG: hypothetical protein JKX75_06920 [Gammaproteobacteria bacterium]|nr:hypothetical protein [Gammaproteobacteria bacterium]
MNNKILITVVLMSGVLSACNVKEAGDSVQEVTQNIVEGVKEVPAALGKASNKVEDDLRN